MNILPNDVHFMHEDFISAFQPLPLALSEALEKVDGLFGIEKILSDVGKDYVQTYYRQSRIGYERLYNDVGAMHIALSFDGRVRKAGYAAQAESLEPLIGKNGAKRILELGCGLGFNTRHLAALRPDCEFVALDMMPQHVRRARGLAKGLTNVSFAEGRHESIPASLGQFDIVFGVETLCYARDLDTVAVSIAAALKPGGRFVMYDPHRKPGFDERSEGLITATRLYEVTTALSNGFWVDGAWEAALERNGLKVIRTDDMTRFALPSLRVLQRRANKVFMQRKWRMAARVLPKYLMRNAVAGLLGPYVCLGDDDLPDLERGTVVYQRIEAIRS